MELQLIERFVFDYEHLALTTFESASYQITSNALILRKFLIDPTNLESFHRFLNPGEIFFLNDIICDQKVFEPVLLGHMRLYIPLMVSLQQGLLIHNYSIVGKEHFSPRGNVKFPETNITYSTVTDFLDKTSLIIDGMPITKREIVEYVSYMQGVIHSGAIPKKKAKLQKVKHLDFNIATGSEKKDALVFFHPNFQQTNGRSTNPASFLTLGNRHEFPTLMILEYSNYVVSSKPVEKLYIIAKEYLVNHDPKYRFFRSDHFFSNQQRLFQLVTAT